MIVRAFQSNSRISLHMNPIMIYVVFIIFDNHIYYEILTSKLMQQLYKVIKNPAGFAYMISTVRGGPIVQGNCDLCLLDTWIWNRVLRIFIYAKYCSMVQRILANFCKSINDWSSNSWDDRFGSKYIYSDYMGKPNKLDIYVFNIYC